MKKWAIVILTVLFTACNTFVLTPAKKRIKGKWEQVVPKPPEGVEKTWEFKEGGILTIYTDKKIVDSAGNVLVDKTTTYSTPYEVKNKITRHMLIANVNNRTEWVIKKINKEELEISSDQKDTNRKGNEQYDFVKK